MTRRFTTADLENLMEGTTPGPWSRSESEWEPHDIRTEDQELWIATTGDGDAGVGRQKLADALLVAAAPEIAAELHRALETIIAQAEQITRLQFAIEEWGYRKEMAQDGLLADEDMEVTNE